MLPTKPCLDKRPYTKHPESQPFGPDIQPGNYVYVQDENGIVWVAPDGPHVHPRVLGNVLPAAGAGELKVGPDGVVTEVNNISFTFQPGPETLPKVVEAIRDQGGIIAPDAVREFKF